MILTVTLNAALDVTYLVDRLRPHTSHRVDTTHRRAGGKGVNVSRVLAALGRETVVTGLVGGPTGDLLRADLATAGLRDELLTVAGESRRTLTVVSREDGDATVFNQPGPPVAPREWAAFRAHFTRLAGHAEVVVLSGSVPPGLPADVYGRLLSTARAAGVPTVLDTGGTALRAALPARPDVVKPNAAELAAATGTPATDTAAAVDTLRAAGARSVVASLGPAGLRAHTPDGAWRAVPPEHLGGNPTGAGDACVAALAAGLADGRPWPDVLRDAVALSAAAVVCPVAGDVDTTTYRRLRTAVRLEDLHAPDTHR
ncbi:1-phosphofructokinase family hexose kinase [Streptomyces chumphonensis]|uniref:1-phosphofructokinase family hexose kinase n=1 Tax=Streptomyces chumphonensis TaxID=1214925 RepID=A0A927EYN0_9ACTN|nr:1-phosphofructokinase family hexose kinase [Streptomyces chumphonensis]MBD3931146.1 1-phosphofructokinase family hexose kinase [Streptomyces chumphonensis]